MAPLSHAECAIFRSVGSYGAALTPKEKEELQEIRRDLKRNMDKLAIIYFRLKFWP